MKAWVLRHRHILLLKAGVAFALVAAHYNPSSRLISLAANLFWLMAF